MSHLKSFGVNVAVQPFGDFRAFRNRLEIWSRLPNKERRTEWIWMQRSSERAPDPEENRTTHKRMYKRKKATRTGEERKDKCEQRKLNVNIINFPSEY